MNRWTVVVNRREHEISVDEDPRTAKTFVRVDGRVAAKPMSRDDEECDVVVDGATYRVMRHETEGWAIDLQPIFVPKNAVAVAPDRSGRWKTPAIAAGAVVVLLLLFGIGWSRSYSHIRWKAYQGDEFSIAFPRTPKVEKRSRGDVLTTSFKDHMFMLQFGNLSNPIGREGTGRLMRDLLEETAKAENGEITSQDGDDWMGHPSIAYSIKVPQGADHPAGRETGRIVMSSYRRFYQYFTFVPADDPITQDTDHFLASFQIPEERPQQAEAAVPVTVSTGTTAIQQGLAFITDTANQPQNQHKPQPPAPAPPTVIAPSWSNTTTH